MKRTLLNTALLATFVAFTQSAPLYASEWSEPAFDKPVDKSPPKADKSTSSKRASDTMTALQNTEWSEPAFASDSPRRFGSRQNNEFAESSAQGNVDAGTAPSKPMPRTVAGLQGTEWSEPVFATDSKPSDTTRLAQQRKDTSSK